MTVDWKDVGLMIVDWKDVGLMIVDCKDIGLMIVGWRLHDVETDLLLDDESFPQSSTVVFGTVAPPPPFPNLSPTHYRIFFQQNLPIWTFASQSFLQIYPIHLHSFPQRET